jgi:hypothetical protein
LENKSKKKEKEIKIKNSEFLALTSWVISLASSLGEGWGGVGGGAREREGGGERLRTEGSTLI